MGTITRTHTRTWPQLNAWASTTPLAADAPGGGVRAGDLCAVPRCGDLLRADQTVYAVTETGGPDAPEPQPCEVNPALTTADCHHAEQWVCWRHVHADRGPV
jgi:hypothetical protein